MNDPQTGFDKPAASGNGAGIGVTIFLCLFALPFAAFGVFALVSGIGKLAAGVNKDSLMPILFGLIFSGVGFGLMFAAIWGRKKLKRDAVMKARFADRPWMVRQDWADGKIKATATAPVWFLLLWFFLALAITAPVLGQIPREWQKGNHAILIVLIFPAAACVLLGYSFVQWRSRRRFGDCFFEPAQTPTPIGGVLEGMIHTTRPVKLEHDLSLKFSCIHRTVTGSGKNRQTHENLLWQNEKIYQAGIDLPEPEPGHSGIPVHFKLPAGQPECYACGNESVFWRLEAKSKMRGPGFHVAFDVPVFNVAGAAIVESDASSADEPDPTTALQASMEEVRRDEHSRIQVSDGPHGREFYFPAARNIGACFIVTLIALFFDAVPVLVYRAGGPVLFTIVFGFVGLLMTWVAFNAWFKSSRVTVDSSGVQATNHWLFIRRSRRFAAADIESFDATVGTTSGSQTFWTIKLLPPGTTLAGGVASKAEADWIVNEMTKALGRR